MIDAPGYADQNKTPSQIDDRCSTVAVITISKWMGGSQLLLIKV